MSKDSFVFFWSGPFSQWYKSEFTLYGVEYNCAEQYVMAMKATMFGDFDSRNQIMATRDPSKQKAIGRKVSGFDADKWSEVAKKFVYEANMAKFSSKSLKKVLLETGDKEIVEASPYDTIWGIGLGPDDPDRFDKSKWRGTNWLGEVLMQVREAIRKENP